ncbi:ABC transporter ATP-binding protein [Mesorhizobium sp.]|uniref:ABC transporter ATP-binding protein n=1 Tax=Mesorhizobium sp. TaxID=1871066 RepID=UPI000FE75ECF|nr:ABC transporter ATP-binding protein [Mesorhizobium sp.]RWG07784.1 MAG: ABC transporter ATP-binding protein [Mesorhizobium sp.]RWH02905.1 MAG: ABC transporter ATP-binding protein [Mesorhizobium sp.]TIN47960.1 MAG: ABC transporter ATP-binding protein [Mesorhizobium sp.]TIR95615.1 MAG: ABC transporter ATP-binding protein [Mesorhizobium sp.]TIS04475.1 MAG: ABC transporter ATP-binding protein [Mesorhizobium sp.]
MRQVPILTVRNLVVETIPHDGAADVGRILHGVSLDVAAGEVLGVIGESGSGKSTMALAALGYTRPGLRITGGSIQFLGREVIGLPADDRRRIRGAEVAYVAQSAAAAFNPSLTINRQVIEASLVHSKFTKRLAKSRALEDYRRLGLPNPLSIGQYYPHQVSGGQLQRLAAAMAFSAGPRLIVFDEPTTALDVTTQIGVLHAFRDELREHNAAALYVTHDLAVVSQIADRVLVMEKGQIIERNDTERILNTPTHPVTRALIAAAQPVSAGSLIVPKKKSVSTTEPVLALNAINAAYGPNTPAVLRNIHLRVDPGEIIAIVGESGSGKSSLARVAAGLLSPSSGEVRRNGNLMAGKLRERTMDDLRRVQIVFQSADTALNPRQRVRDILARPLDFYRRCNATQRHDRIAKLLELVSLPASFASRFPSELSGGQKQRLNLARALAADPDLVLCDEVTSALDVVVRQEIVALLRRLRETLGTAFVFITHDLSTAGALADRVVVMRGGVIVEEGPTARILNSPSHSYTRLLLASVPIARKGWLDEAIAAADAAGVI